MKLVTKKYAKVDGIACQWLIKKFIDENAEFLFVQSSKVPEIMSKDNAISFDIPNVELGHHGDECSFDAIIKKYDLLVKNPELFELARIIRGADTDKRQLTPQSMGLATIAAGFSLISKDDYDNIVKQFPLYDALYAFVKSNKKDKLLTSRH